MKKLILIIILSAVSLACYADNLYIPFDKDIKVTTVKERAVISWNGFEEILVVSSDIKSNKAGKVLKILPLPFEPDVKTSALDIFSETREMINRKLGTEDVLDGYADKDARVDKLDTDLSFYTETGSGEIIIEHFVLVEEFTAWVKKYFEENEGIDIVIPEGLTKKVGDIIEGAYTWFALEVVSVTGKTQTTEPVQYRFKTKKEIYFPVHSDSSYEDRDIELYIISSRLFGIFPGIKYDDIKLIHDPVLLNNQDLDQYSTDVSKLHKDDDEVRCRMWQIKGPLAPFERGATARLGLMRL